MFRRNYFEKHGNYGRYHSPCSYYYWYLYPRATRFYYYGDDDTDRPDTNKEKEEKEEKEPELETLVVKKLDLCIQENTVAHHTDEYEITDGLLSGREPQLVVRRGQVFEIKVTTDRGYDKEKDDFTLNLHLGDSPKPSKGTVQRLALRSAEDGLERWKWSAALRSQDDEVLTIQLQSPPTCLIGKWKLSLDTKKLKERTDENDEEEEEAPKINKYAHKERIYIIFNPWCKEDQVFMEDEVWRDEAILNESGKIYTGNYKQIGSKPWNFGQFDKVVLDCALRLLEKAKLNMPTRGDPVKIVRTMSAIVNDCDDGGVLSGNWSGEYEGGTAPTAWVGSIKILKEYMEKEEPVKFGQCWVFSALTTTLCRALGIPTRSVTNFASAHDCDGSITIDKYWDEDGDPKKEFNDDSVWNFHVWNEAWMSRMDLPKGFDGWQAFDATPQETSEGVYQAGPCSVAAIKQGCVGHQFDGPFIMAEVNADKVHWVLQKDGSWKTSVDKASVGKKISTKKPRKAKPGSNTNRWAMFDRNPERLDVTNEYKFPEGSELERAAVYRANQGSSRPGLYHDKGDVGFDLEIKDDILVGNNFEIKVRMQNKSRNDRAVHLKMSLCPCFYTGISKPAIKVQDYSVEIPPIKTQEVTMRVTHEDYLNTIVDQVAFKVLVGAKVDKTEQIFNTEDDFRLRRPDVLIEGPSSGKVNEEFEVTLKVINPMPIQLTECEWQIEGPGIKNTEMIKEKNVDAYQTVELKVTLTPLKKGSRQIQASFSAKELADVTGCHDIEIEG